MEKTFLETPSATARMTRARVWLAARAPAEEVLIVAASAEAANELIRSEVAARGPGASFGWHRTTLPRLAAELARPLLIEANLVPVGHLAFAGVVARVVHELAGAGRLGRYAEVASTPGFPRAAAAAIEELRMARLEPGRIAEVAPELALLLEETMAELARVSLADRAQVFEAAVRAARDPESRHPLLGLPALLLDVPLCARAEEELVAAIAGRAPSALATVPAGDAETLARFAGAGFARAGAEPAAAPAPARKSRAASRARAETPPASAPTGALARLQASLFEGPAPELGPLDDEVVILSAPGESRECVEIARRLIAEARAGTPFDRMAVLLRSVEEYRPHLEEALARAGIPAFFARGAVRPDPAGRAFVALLACACERLSAQRFAEYLSLAVVPDATREGAPPPAAPRAERYVAPEEEMLPQSLAEAALERATRDDGTKDAAADAADAPAAPLDPDASPVVAGTLRAPRRWEQLLVDAAVIGGRERWRRRLDGLEHELNADLAELRGRDPDDPAAARIERQLADLAALRDFALPLLDELASLPESADWGTWIDCLTALATRALREPTRVLAALSELAPMAPIGPVGLSEVREVLSKRLLEVAVPPPTSRYGRVFVAPADAARGLSFAVVCVPGLAEKLFPREIREEPLLLDRARAALSPDLATNDTRVRRERLALRIAAGAAERRLVLSYPRLDMEKARPRVPSFYTLESVRAAEGRLPGFDELAEKAERVVQARIGWPAPARAEDAIDEAEHDLALLDSLLRLDPTKSVGTARYLMQANPHLGRALRFRARRWLKRWTPADGLVDPSPEARAALAGHRLPARSYSATALEHYAACPYRFLLQAVHRLAPREVPTEIDEMDALQRGSLVHDVQFALFERLQRDGLLPVGPANLEQARACLEEVLDDIARKAHDELAPAIERVWQESVAGIRADLREWLRRMSEDDSGFVPSRFELAFGLSSQRNRDRRSQWDAVALDSGISLRGSIDLVEDDGAGRIRVTDHKTGKVRLTAGGVVGGGSVLQPVLYALAAEKMFPGTRVVEGRLSYCTSNGGFAVRSVPLDDQAREAAAALAAAVGEGLDEGFLPALPTAGACRWCDYAVVCGPYEVVRSGRKPKEPPHAPAARVSLEKLRRLP